AHSPRADVEQHQVVIESSQEPGSFCSVLRGVDGKSIRPQSSRECVAEALRIFHEKKFHACAAEYFRRRNRSAGDRSSTGLRLPDTFARTSRSMASCNQPAP